MIIKNNCINNKKIFINFIFKIQTAGKICRLFLFPTDMQTNAGSTNIKIKMKKKAANKNKLPDFIHYTKNYKPYEEFCTIYINILLKVK
jgi:hypothetical protein